MVTNFALEIEDREILQRALEAYVVDDLFEPKHEKRLWVLHDKLKVINW